jgi:hypothetical protein
VKVQGHDDLVMREDRRPRHHQQGRSALTSTVVDGNDLAAVMADAGMAPEVETPNADTPVAKTDDKPVDATKTDPVVEAEVEEAEDAEGLTEKERAEWSKAMQKRVGRKHRQMKEAEEFAADQIRLRREAEVRAADLERQVSEARARDKPAAAKPATEPQREDFATDAEFVKASVKWGVDQGIAEREAQREQRELDAGVERRFQAAMNTVPDFQTVIEANPLSFPEHMRAYVRESDMSAEICYYFAKQPLALEKIKALHAVRQLVELGKIEAKLQPFGSSQSSSKAGDKPEASGKADASPSTTDTGFRPSKTRSDAPVIKPLSQGDGAQVEVDPEKMTTRQMIEDFQKTNKVNLNARKRH